MTEVQRIFTPVTPKQAATILMRVWPKVSEKPTREQARLILAQIWLETAAGKQMVQYNWGNTTISSNPPDFPPPSPPFWRPPWFTIGEESSDRMKYLNAKMLEGKAPSAFRAYKDHDDGALHHLSMVKNQFPILWKASQTGDPEQFAKAIFDSRYASREIDGSEGPVANSLSSLVAQFEHEGLFNELRPLAHSRKVKRRTFYRDYSSQVSSTTSQRSGD
jgi:hypothetical protein